MLENCLSFNSPVMIAPNSKLQQIDYMFMNCRNFNQKFIIPDTVCTIDGLFKNCENFNQKINLPDHISKCISVFENCKNFNQSVIIPNCAYDCTAMFKNCEKLNNKIHTPSVLSNTKDMFKGCKSFNQKISLPVPQCPGPNCYTNDMFDSNFDMANISFKTVKELSFERLQLLARMSAQK